MKILILLLALTAQAGAAELKISAAGYDEAAQAKNYFKFIGHSRKLGIIGTSFEGYAKQARLSYDAKKDRFENVKLVIEVAALDTDNSSRNEKMMDTCLSQKQFPEITVTLKESIDAAKESQEIPAEMNVRGETVPLKITLEKSEGAFKGTSSFRLSEAKIPDPSILVASVKDEFEIEFQVIPEKSQ